MTEDSVILEIKKLEKSFGGLKAVDRCSVEVKEGSITGLMGPNGAGKTTLFNLITGFYKSDKGEIWFHGEEITSLPVHRVVRKGIGRTFQIPRELREMTVLENLMLVPDNQKGEYIWNSVFRSRTEPKIVPKQYIIRVPCFPPSKFIADISQKLATSTNVFF